MSETCTTSVATPVARICSPRAAVLFCEAATVPTVIVFMVVPFLSDLLRNTNQSQWKRQHTRTGDTGTGSTRSRVFAGSHIHQVRHYVAALNAVHEHNCESNNLQGGLTLWKFIARTEVG